MIVGGSSCSSKISTVSQSWRSFLNSTPKFWSDLDLSSTRKIPPVATVATYIKRSRGTDVNAKLSGHTMTPRVLKSIATRCKALARLEISGGLTGESLIDAAPALSGLRTLLVDGQISLYAVCQIFSHCSSLETARFISVLARYPAYWTGDLSRLRSLSITTSHPEPWNDFTSSRTLSLLQLVS